MHGDTRDHNFQRAGALSNTHVGRAFEASAKAVLAASGIVVRPRYKLPLGVAAHRKDHEFDLGSDSPKVIVECKSRRWTEGGNMPSAKVTVWNEAMFYFSLAPADYRKIMFVLRDFHAKRQLTLAEYYLKRHPHLVPAGVEFWEYDESTDGVKQLI